MKLKKDKYFAVRGGKAKILEISCFRCGEYAFLYQKDGIGGLHRCYLNRIHGPQELVYKIANDDATASLSCRNCGNILATLHKHTDGRLAYNLKLGEYTKKVKSVL